MVKANLLCLGLAAVLLLVSSEPLLGQGAATVDGAKTYQLIDGFGVNANYWSWNGTDLQPVLDALINQAGMTLFRVIFNEGWETNNDNGDPSVMNWDYYNQVYTGPDAEKLWGLIGYLNQRGITNGIMPNFQGHGPDWMVTWNNVLIPGYEDEWAERVASLLVYAKNTRHLQFNLVGPGNEPELTTEGITIPTADQYVTALHSLAEMLDANGLSDMRIVGPDRCCPADTTWLPEILADPVVMAKLAHFGLHSYSDWGSGSDGVYDLLQASDDPDRTFWMTEFNVWCEDCESGAGNFNGWDYFRGTAKYLLCHLANGASGGMVWEAYDSYYPFHGGPWSFWGLFALDDLNVVPRTYTPRKNFYTLSQITKFVRPGARRIDLSNASSLYMVAFYHPGSGQVTIVGENSGASPVVLNGTLTNLPVVAALDLYYTDGTTNLCHEDAFEVASGNFAATVPADCIFTLVGVDAARYEVSVLITNPPDGAHFPAPATISIDATATTTNGTLSSVQFFNGATQIGEAGAPPYSLTWSNVPPGSYVLTASATNSAGHAGVSPGVRVIVTGPAVQLTVAPTNAILAPYGSQQFTATAKDALGNQLDPSPPFVWAASGGGVISTDGLFTAGPCVGGPFLISASSGGLIGTANVSITTTSLNLAPAGTGFTWFAMSARNSSSPRKGAPRINDGDTLTDVSLLGDAGVDIHNAYEAAGVLWASPQTICRVIYYNGSYTAVCDGVFSAEFGLQFSLDGTTWVNAPPEWTLDPAYSYNSPVSANTSFTFTGGVATVSGLRCVGRVHTDSTPTNSWVAFATELQAFAVPALPLPLLTAQAGQGAVVISWPGCFANYGLQTASDLAPPVIWAPLTNTPEQAGDWFTVTLPVTGVRQFFRLYQQ